MTFADAVANITALFAVVSAFGLVGLTVAAAVDLIKKMI